MDVSVPQVRVQQGDRRIAGYSLIEIMVVVCLLAILGALGFAAYQGFVARAKAAEVLETYSQVRTGVGERIALATNLVDECDALGAALDNTQPLASRYVGVSYGFQGVAGGGYRPVITVCGDASNASHRVAREAHALMAEQGLVEPGAVVTDSLVSFSLRLSDSSAALCQTPVTPAASRCAPAAPPAKPAANPPSTTAATAPPQPPAALAVADPPAGSTPPTACPAGQAANPLGGCMPPACPDGQIRDASGSCVVPTADTPHGPPEKFANCRLVDAGTATRQTDTVLGDYRASDAMTASRAPSPIPPGTGPEHDMQGSDCHVCGDEKDGPCNDLDLILGMTNTCPNRKPICNNRAIRQADGSIAEYRSCITYDDVFEEAAKSQCAGGSYDVGAEVGSQCSFSCYGDACNLIQVGDTTNNVALVCD